MQRKSASSWGLVGEEDRGLSWASPSSQRILLSTVGLYLLTLTVRRARSHNSGLDLQAGFSSWAGPRASGTFLIFILLSWLSPTIF